MKCKIYFDVKEDFGPQSNSPVLFLLSPGKMLLMLSLAQQWLHIRNATVKAPFLTKSVCGTLTPATIHSLLELTFPDNPFKPVVVPVACATFHSSPLSLKMLWYITLSSQAFQQWPSVSYPPHGGCWWSSNVKSAAFPMVVPDCAELYWEKLQMKYSNNSINPVFCIK